MVRSAYELHAEDDDFGQAGTLVREIWNDAQRAEFVDTVAGHLLGGVKGEVLEKAFDYWKSVDGDTGKQIEEKVRAGIGGDNPGGEPGQAKADASAPIVEGNTNAG